MPETELSLAADFPAASDEKWRALVAGVLSKSGLEFDALTSTTYDGIAVQPLYTAATTHPGTGVPGQAPFVRGATAAGATEAGWDVRQLHADPDAKATNRAVLDDLAAGATSVWLRVGAGAIEIADLPVALDGVYLDLAPVVLEPVGSTDPSAVLFALLGLAEQRGLDLTGLRGTVGADPIGQAARSGAEPDMARLLAVTEQSKGAPHLIPALVDATVLHDAGASDAQELAYATAVGVTYLRALTEAGLDVDEALNHIEFRLAVTDDQFGSIAKLRAARRLWARVAELSGAAPTTRGQRQHAVTSAAMLTQRDPWVNLLRTTIATFAAAVGGADAITTLPFDNAIGLPDEFARRIARNTQSVLHDESSLARVLDPAGGSWYVETLTDELARTAWEQFTRIERVGGAAVALAAGSFAADVEATRAAREDRIAHRTAPITGVSEFALLTEEPLVRKPAPVLPTQGDLAPHRYAESFEALRDRSDAAAARPTVFVAALGPFAAHSGRVGFAANLLAAGGIATTTGTGTPDELITAFTASDTTVAVLASSDKIYADEAEATAAALKAAGATFVWLAGKPGEYDHVDGYLFMGVNAIDVLTTTLDQLGVAK
jgi:methylmalonyl-CoA mutase